VSGAEAAPDGFGAAIGLANTAAGGGRWYLRAGATNTNTPAGGFSIADDQAYRLTIDHAGKVGIGTLAPQSLLQIKSLTAIDEGATAAGAWANFGSNAYFDGAWKRVDTGKAGVNLHMNADDGVSPVGQEFRFLRMDTSGATQNIAVLGRSVSFILADKVGIGTNAPAQRLSVSGAETAMDGFGAAIGLANTAAGGAPWYLRAGATGTATPAMGFSIADDQAYRLTIDNAGNVGVGTTTPGKKLDIAGGALRIGNGHVITNNANGALVLNAGPADASNLAGIWFRRTTTLGDETAFTDLMRVTVGGNVGIGTTAPTMRLDVADRIRLRSGSSGSAGLWLYQSGPANDRAFIGMMNDNVVGFWSANGWGLQWDGITGTLWVRGSISAGGGKGGYVMDQFINSVGEVLEQGDVVVIGGNQASEYYGVNDNIPIPEVDATDRVCDTRVCGIVCAVHAETTPTSPSSEPNPEPKRQTEETQAAPPGGAGAAPLLDGTKVAPGQVGWMVTLGAYANCKVDADTGPIAVGDLLTTSATKGHAQKVLDPAKATGAILGKALGSLGKGKGKIPVLVTLQ
jgi:hypothetical protein